VSYEHAFGSQTHRDIRINNPMGNHFGLPLRSCWRCSRRLALS